MDTRGETTCCRLEAPHLSEKHQISRGHSQHEVSENVQQKRPEHKVVAAADRAHCREMSNRREIKTLEEVHQGAHFKGRVVSK